MKFLRSFVYAWRGLKVAWKEQFNLKVHFFIAIIVLMLGLYLSFSKTDLVILLLTIGFVIVSEILNTVAEELVNAISPEWSDRAGKIKDLAAGAVLFSSIVAIIIGAILFSKYLLL